LGSRRLPARGASAHHDNKRMKCSRHHRDPFLLLIRGSPQLLAKNNLGHE